MIFIARGITTKCARCRRLFFSDSLVCICYLTDTWPAPTNQELARAARAPYQNIAGRFPLFRLYWVKGHSKTEGNDVADELAVFGSSHCRDISKEKLACIAPDMFVEQSHRNIIDDIIDSDWLRKEPV
jgi:hypothetical protein